MASGKRPEGVIASRVAANLRTIRTERGLSTYQLSDRMTEIGWPIAQTGIARIETGNRQVTVDDLVALSLALDCSPNRLLMPDLDELRGESAPGPRGILSPDLEPVPVQVTEKVSARPLELWAWAAGELPLVVRDGLAVHAASRHRAHLFEVQNRPHRHLGQDPANHGFRYRTRPPGEAVFGGVAGPQPEGGDDEPS